MKSSGSLLILNDVPTFQIEAGVDLERIEFDLRETIGLMARSIHRAHDRGLEMARHILNDVPNRLQDRYACQVLLNLLQRHQVHRGGEVVVKLRASLTKGVILHFEVRDTGTAFRWGS